MSIQTIVRSSLIAAGVLASATAFARQPPALQNAQERSEAALCAGARAVGGAGYRDASIRFQNGASSNTERSAVAQTGGYRDAYTRLGISPARGVVACTPPAPVVSHTARR
jgi:hypothetical protein